MSGKAERMRWILAGALAACCFAGPAGADSLWKDADRSFFVDHRARDVGDLVTVLIVEQASGSNAASGQTSKENKFSTSGGPGAGLFKFLGAFSADAKSKNDFSGSGQASVANKLNARLTARVVQVDPAGNLVVQGSRLVAVNHDQEELTLTATVRPEDVRADNTVLSTYLADAAISYRGHGPNAAAQHQGLLSRVLNWIF